MQCYIQDIVLWKITTAFYIVKFADKVLVMNRGQLFCYADIDTVFSKSKELQMIGLDIPQITKLSHLLKSDGVDIGNDIYTVARAKERITELLKGKKNA